MERDSISIIIRNKNEGENLKKTLSIIRKVYVGEIDDIIVVDNNSTDNSVEVAYQYGCKVCFIDEFTYGKAINFGLSNSKSKYNLVLSSHAVPIGSGFFLNSKKCFQQTHDLAAIRYVNSIENYSRAVSQDFVIDNPFKHGLNAACCMINKTVWENIKFNEELIANEDKHWSKMVIDAGYKILCLNETYFYFKQIDYAKRLKRYEKETITHCIMEGKNFSSKTRIFLSFFKKIAIQNTQTYFKGLYHAFLALKTNIVINKTVKSFLSEAPKG